ncbi:MAG: PilZ domain-containing protein [Candidatus Eisenbacteria bacterium]
MVEERRKHRRATLEVPIDAKGLSADGHAFKARTVNLSAGGFYCKVPFFVPVLTKLRVSIAIPIRDTAGKDEEHVIVCEGMVVRIVPEKPDDKTKTYEIGCFFTEIDSYDRLMIEQYLAEGTLQQ